MPARHRAAAAAQPQPVRLARCGMPIGCLRNRRAITGVIAHQISETFRGTRELPNAGRCPELPARGGWRGHPADPFAACAKAARGALSANTERAVRSDLSIYYAWCTERCVPTLPASAETIAAFVDAMAKVRAPATRPLSAPTATLSSYWRAMAGLRNARIER